MKNSFFFSFLVYLLLIAVVFPYVRWYADNPDTFQYLEISRKYLSGDWAHAVNGYWSPFISWMLMIPLIIFNDDVIAFKLLQGIIGAFTLFQWCRLLEKTALSFAIRTILLFTAIPFIIDYAFLNCTPDLLFMGCLLLLLNLFIKGNIFSISSNAIVTGITGGVLFLVKSFGLPFFIAASLVVLFIEIKQSKQKIVPGNIAVMYGFFAGICLLWILPLSSHYGQFTISRAADFNMSRDAAPLPGRSEELPILGTGLNMPLENCKSAWETPGAFVSNEKINLFHSTFDYLKIIERNLFSIYYFDFRNQVGILFLILLIVFGIWRGFGDLIKKSWIFLILLFIVIIYGGYCLILVHSRYIWINSLLMLLLSTYFIMQLINSERTKTILSILLILIILLSVKRPVKDIIFTADKNYPAHWLFNSLKHPFETMWLMYRSDLELQNVIHDLQKKKLIFGNAASLKANGMDRDSYTSSLRIVLANSGRYFGQLDETKSFTEQEELLLKNKIDYLITWKNTEWGGAKAVYYNNIAGVRIYSTKD